MTESYKMLQLVNIFNTYTQSENFDIHLCNLGNIWTYVKQPLSSWTQKSQEFPVTEFVKRNS